MLNLNHSKASFLSNRYHELNTVNLINQFQNVGFNIASQDKSQVTADSFNDQSWQYATSLVA